MPETTLFAGEYSSRNVGDGIIKLAIRKLCLDHNIKAEYRDFYGNAVPSDGPATPQAAKQPGGIKQALLSVRPFKYAIALLFYFTRYKGIASRYEVQRYRRVVIGGGNLLMDNFWNFPLLILRIVQQCEDAAIPVSLFAVGAGKQYSWLGKRIVARIVRSEAVTHVVCRDPHSQRLVSAAAGADHDHKVVAGYDSGLYLERRHDQAPQGAKVGLGVISPRVLSALFPDHPMANETVALKWWANLVDALARQVGVDNIELISNGSPPDNEFAQRLVAALRRDHPGLASCYIARNPEALLERVGSYRALLACRMHAAVSAMALDIPVMGVEWDPKVRQLFAYCGRPAACVPLSQFKAYTPDHIVRSLLAATPTELDPIRSHIAHDFELAVGRRAVSNGDDIAMTVQKAGQAG